MKRVSFVGRRHSLAKIVVRGLGSFGVYWAAFVFLGPLVMLVAMLAAATSIEWVVQRSAADGRFISAFERQPGQWRVYYGTTEAAKNLAKSMVMDDVSADMASIFRNRDAPEAEV